MTRVGRPTAPRDWESRALKAEAELAQIRKIISDGRAVHLNTLRGGIAKMTPAEIGHLYRGDEGAQVIGEIRRQSPDAGVSFYPPLMVKPGDNRAGADARLVESYVRQQKFVPDQTALVWRMDLGNWSGELVWRRAAQDALRSINTRLEAELAEAKQVSEDRLRSANRLLKRARSAEAAAKAFPPLMSDLSGLLDRLQEVSGFAQEDDLLVVRRGAVGNKRQRAAAARALETYAHAVKAGKAPLYCMDVADEIVAAWLSFAPASSKLIAVLRTILGGKHENNGGNA